MAVSRTELRALLAEVQTAIADLLNGADANDDVAAMAARRAALAELQRVRRRVAGWLGEAAAAELAPLAAAVDRAAVEAERGRVEAVLNGLKAAVAAELETVRTMLREIEPAPAEAGAAVPVPAPPVSDAPELDDPPLLRHDPTGRPVYGHVVLGMQQALTAAGFDTSGLDLTFGKKTAAALAAWHETTGQEDAAALSAQEWRVLTGARIPDLFDICAQVTAAFEGHGFHKAVGDFDGAVATWGYHGYTVRYGHLQAVLNATEAASPGILDEIFGATRGAALRGMLATPLADQIAWGRRELLEANGALSPSWALGLAALGARPACQAAQLAHSRKAFWETIALPQVRRLGLREALSHGLLFDTAIQQNGLGADALAGAEAEIAKDPAMPESGKRAIIAAAAVASIGKGRFRDDVKARRETFVTGRGRVHGGRYDLSFWGMAAAFDERESALDAATVPAAPLVSFDAPAEFETWFTANVTPLAPNFSPGEFLRLGASHAPGAKCAGLNAPPPRPLWKNCLPLVRALQAFRDRVGAPVTILGMYRSPDYNACVGGAARSQHLRFAAADIRAPSAGTPANWAKILRALRDEGVFRGGVGLYRTFVHVDVRGENVDWTG